MTHIRIGQAEVKLDDDERSICVTYDLDDMLDAAARVASVLLLEDDAKYAIEALSDLRQELAARYEARRARDQLPAG